MSRLACLAIGWTAVGFGIAGALLPVVPTTPFLLVALWAFARSSPRLAEWLRRHPRLGPYVRDWEETRAIPPRAKLLAIVMMALSLAWLILATEVPVSVKWGTAAVLALVALFILTRPNAGRDLRR